MTTPSGAQTTGSMCKRKQSPTGACNTTASSNVEALADRGGIRRAHLGSCRSADRNALSSARQREQPRSRLPRGCCWQPVSDKTGHASATTPSHGVALIADRRVVVAACRTAQMPMLDGRDKSVVAHARPDPSRRHSTQETTLAIGNLAFELRVGSSDHSTPWICLREPRARGRVVPSPLKTHRDLSATP